MPTPFDNRPSSLANDVCHVVADVPRMRCLYSSDAPVVGSRTEFMECEGDAGDSRREREC